MATVGYIKIEFPQRLKQRLGRLVGEITKPADLFYSSAVPHIQGDVTADLHFTLFFGLKSEETENPALIKYVKDIKLGELELGSLTLAKGYRGMYQLLLMEVKDVDSKLQRLSKEFLKFDCDLQMLHDEFSPHVTLAYVTASYELPIDGTDFNINVRPQAVRIDKFEDE